MSLESAITLLIHLVMVPGFTGGYGFLTEIKRAGVSGPSLSPLLRSCFILPSGLKLDIALVIPGKMGKRPIGGHSSWI